VRPEFRPQWLALALAGFVLLGCATGRDFTRPPDSQFALGKTRKAEIIAKMGAPESEKSNHQALKDVEGLRSKGMAAEGEYATIDYRFSDPAGQGIDGVKPMRAAYFYFWNDVLIRYSFTSSFKRDSTAFPESPVAAIIRDHTTEREVREMFGRPSGRAMYPATARADLHALEYRIFEWKAAEGVYSNRRLNVMIDRQGIVRDYVYDTTTDAIPAAPSGGVPYYVTVPRVKK
jgi:hypothetical protein